MNLTKVSSVLLAGALMACPGLTLAQTGAPQAGGQTGAQPGSTQPSTQPGAGVGPASGMPTSGTAGAGAATDKMFVMKAAQGGLTEIKLGELASQKSSSDDVKQFGEKMVKDHTQLNEDMKPIAQSMGVTPPAQLNKKHQKMYDKLSGMSGDEFDKAYLSAMVKDHHDDLKDFKSEASSTQNADLKAAVQKGTTVIEEHTAMVEKLAQSKGAMASTK